MSDTHKHTTHKENSAHCASITVCVYVCAFHLRDALQHPDQPFYIHVNPIAPHESCAPRADVSDGDSCNLNPVPATRHAYLYNDVQLPQYDNYGEYDKCVALRHHAHAQPWHVLLCSVKCCAA